MTKLGIRTLVVITALALAGPAWAGGNFRAHLNGASQVPPADSQGQGQFIGKLHDGALRYRLVVANIENVVAAHIHCGDTGMNGPVGVTLFVGGPVSTSGPLARGPILAPDTNNGCGWADVDDIIDALESGDTYINVHTLQNLPGEIRGQVDPPGNEGVCDGLRGGTPGLHGLCVAFCEAQDCNATYDEATGEMTLDPNCKPSADGLLDAYIERSTAGDPHMPCVNVVSDPCPCWTEDS